MTMLEYALSYAEQGFKVVAVNEEDKTPYQDVPCHGVKTATTDTKIITDAWKKHPNAMIGIAIPDGWLWFDGDTHNGEKGPERLQNNLKGLFFNTYRETTGTGGVHVFFKLPAGYDGSKLPNRWHDKNAPEDNSIEIYAEADKRYFIVAPSVKADGSLYTSMAGSQEECAKNLAEMSMTIPTEILDRILRDEEEWKKATKKNVSDNKTSSKKPFAKIDMKKDRRLAYAQSAFKDEVEKVRATLEGNRDNQLNTSALKIFHYVKDGLLDEEEVREAFYEAASETGLPDNQIRLTIDSAYYASAPHDEDFFPTEDKPAMKVKSEQKKQEEAIDLNKYSIRTYIKSRMDADRKQFKDIVPTGYQNLDDEADGLRPGLYVLAGTSSLGKTTFLHQMAENIAKTKDVLYFSLEQSSYELVSKSIARISCERSASSIMKADQFTNNEQDALNSLCDMVEDRLNIIEGDFAITPDYISDVIKTYIEKKGVHPVVFIDYLQIMQSSDDNKPLRERIDGIITSLKQISRGYQVPVVVISAVNRANYLNPIDFESIKESGGIEYTADVIWGLQFSIMEKDEYQGEKDLVQKRKMIKEEKERETRYIDLVCLKNRFGKMYSCHFKYQPGHDLYTSCSEEDYAPTEMMAGAKVAKSLSQKMASKLSK